MASRHGVSHGGFSLGFSKSAVSTYDDSELGLTNSDGITLYGSRSSQ